VIRLEPAVTGAIILNGIAFGWGLIDPVHAEIADQIEHGITALFVAEMAIKLHSQRLAYFRHGWHWFDAVVILLSLVPMLPGTAVLRMARLARLAKLVHLARHAAQLRLITLARRRVHTT
jgi:voltage-gated sodium channel